MKDFFDPIIASGLQICKATNLGEGEIHAEA